MSRFFRRAVAYTALATSILLVAVTTPARAAGGDLDPSFSGDGKKTIDFAGRFEQANAVVIQPNGRIVMAGEIHDGRDVGLVRLNRFGHFDRSFGDDGRVASDLG